jgi:nicotinamidase-related amidase
MEFNKYTTAFLACHWQNDVVGSDGAFTPFYRARMEEHGVIHVARRLIDSARRSGVRVVYARVAFAEAHRDLVTNIPLLSLVLQQQCLLDGTSATEIIDELEPQAEDWVIRNTKVSAFASSDRDERRAARASTPWSCSVSRPISPWRHRAPAGDLGYRVVIVADACEAATDRAHEASLRVVRPVG